MTGLARQLAHRRRVPVVTPSASDEAAQARRAGVNTSLRKPEDMRAARLLGISHQTFTSKLAQVSRLRAKAASLFDFSIFVLVSSLPPTLIRTTRSPFKT